MLLAILAVWFGYKKARDTGRNAILWGILCGGAFIGIQLLMGIGIGMIMALGVELWGWSESIFTDYELAVSVIAWVPGIVTLWLLFRYLDRVPEAPAAIEPPPPPPTFGQIE